MMVRPGYFRMRPEKVHKRLSAELSKREFTFDYSFWSHDSFRALENGLMVPETDKYWGQERVFNEVGLEIINNSW